MTTASRERSARERSAFWAMYLGLVLAVTAVPVPWVAR